MKKVLVLLLLMVSTSVFAEWTRVAGTPDGDITAYADSETIKRKGSKVKMWSMNDYKTVHSLDNGGYLSGASYDEYDCEGGTRRMLDLYLYSGNMRSGDIVYSSNNIKDEATSILPGSIDETLFKITCSKK